MHQAPEHAEDPRTELRREVADAFLHAYSQLNSNTGKTLEASSFLYALIEILSDRGIISIEELDAKKRVVAERLMAKFRDQRVGTVLQDPEIDKYTFQDEVKIDCAAKLHLCHAACCKLPFALSRQDVQEHVIQWDLSQPYMISHGSDGYCCHLDRDSKCCTVREHRPLPCRAYDCRADKRIWLDFDNGVVNPEILDPRWPAPQDENA
jgi:Fe-S-cluster containining protein